MDESRRTKAESTRPGDRSTRHALETTCARCGVRVGLLWFQGHSTLFDGAINSDGAGNLVVTRHVCQPGPGNLVVRKHRPR